MTTSHTRVDLPLLSLKIVDATDGAGEMSGRIFAELGADVIRVEPVGGSASRARPPLLGDVSLPFIVNNDGKRTYELDLSSPSGRATLLSLTDDADIVLDGGQLRRAGITYESLRERNPRTVLTSITNFGLDGPYADFVATEWVHAALNSVLSRSGIPGMAPLLPPAELVEGTSNTQACWASLVAYWEALRTGHGQLVDLSIYEATIQSWDPPFGVSGSAAGGVEASSLPRGRPDSLHMYPFFACADGYVRIFIAAARQWRGMFSWLGEPPEFSDPKYENPRDRHENRDRLFPLIGKLFADQTRDELVALGDKFGVPVASVQAPSDVLRDEHFVARGSWSPMTLPSGEIATRPSGFVEINGQRAQGRPKTPDESPMFATTQLPAPPAGDPALPPFAGLRVLDLGVIVVGAETARLFADFGADVIKIESSAYPDGNRSSLTGELMTASFARGHRNKESLGINLRSPEGKELFLRLVAVSDIVLSNFKPGTLESLGLDYDCLRQVNPSIVMVDSSALGATGPARRRMGYGPLVRAWTGLSDVWRLPDVAGGFCDGITVYPDHTAARMGAVGALAMLIGRLHSGHGGTVSISQAEVMLNQFAASFLRESFEPGSFRARGNMGQFDAPDGLYPCAGDDEWCVVAVRNDDDFARLCEVIEAPDLASDETLSTPSGRMAHREHLDARLREWTELRTSAEVMWSLQRGGVPAGRMNRVNDLPNDPHLAYRKFFRTMYQPQRGITRVEGEPASYGSLRIPELRPAPLRGEQSRRIARRVLGLSDSEIEDLISRAVLEEA